MKPIKNFICLFQEFLVDFIQTHSEKNQFQDILLYATTNGGKRTRPVLCYLFYDLFNQHDNKAVNNNILLVALSLELIHCYSLVHDDLPSMDNDDLRRGQPTVHIKYSEANAILAGDALQAMAFSALAALESSLPSNITVHLIKMLAHASGALGMVNGQFLDMTLHHNPDLQAIQKMHAGKTGALIKASCMMGAIAAELTDEKQLGYVSDVGGLIGQIFQIQDDILDITQSTDILGKTANKDMIQHKPTLPSLIGVEKAKTEVNRLAQELFQALSHLGGDTTIINEFLQNLLTREF